MPASAICKVNNTILPVSGTTGYNTTANATIQIGLSSTAGVASWSIAATSADDLTFSNGNLTAINNSITTLSTYEIQVTMPPMLDDGYRGAGVQFTSIINAGTSTQNIITFGVWVPNSNGTRLFFGGETNEGNATVGNAEQLNSIMIILAQLQG